MYDLVAAVGDQQVTLTWSNPAYTHNIQPQYRVHGDESWINAGGALFAPTATKVVTGLTNGVAYDFRLTLTGPNSSTGDSNVANATPATAGTPLSAGTIVVTGVGDGSVTIGESAGPGGGTAPYTVALYRGTASIDPPGTGTLIATSLPYADTGRTNGVEYFYVARYTDDAEAGENSNEVSATPEDPEEGEPDVEISFGDYADRAALLADTDWVEVHLGNGVSGYQDIDAVELDPFGAKTLRYDYTHQSPGCDSITLGRAFRFTARQDVWAEFYVKWTDNFTTGQAGCSTGDHKLIFGDTVADGSGRWAFYVGNGLPGNTACKVERPMSEAGLLGPYSLNISPRPTPDQLWDGEWHVIRLYHKNSTTPTSADGAFKVWIDGGLYHNQSGFNTRKTQGNTTDPELINGFSFAHNKDDGPPGELMSIYWGRIRCYFTDPGW